MDVALACRTIEGGFVAEREDRFLIFRQALYVSVNIYLFKVPCKKSDFGIFTSKFYSTNSKFKSCVGEEKTLKVQRLYQVQVQVNATPSYQGCLPLSIEL